MRYPWIELVHLAGDLHPRLSQLIVASLVGEDLPVLPDALVWQWRVLARVAQWLRHLVLGVRVVDVLLALDVLFSFLVLTVLVQGAVVQVVVAQGALFPSARFLSVQFLTALVPVCVVPIFLVLGVVLQARAHVAALVIFLGGHAR